MNKILIVDDNETIRSLLREALIREGFLVDFARDCQEAYALFEEGSFDLILLDVMMPEMDGFTLCKKIRRTSMIPIIMITARGEDFDRIMGLEIGADDYIVKPFVLEEVVARIKAVLRRIQPTQSSRIYIEGLDINIDNYTVLLEDEPLQLSKKEIEILYTLASYPEQVFSRDNILDLVWGYDYYGDIRTVDSHIKRLRSKLDLVEEPKWSIKTVWGVGYKFEVNEDE